MEKNGQLGAIKALFDMKPLKNLQCKQVAFEIIAMRNDSATLDWLIKQQGIPPGGHVALKLACGMGHFECARLLLDAKVDPSVENKECFVEACANGHDRLVALLLKHPKVNPAARQSLGFRLACGKGHSQVVQLLLEDKRVDPTVVNDVVDHFVTNGYVDILKLLLKDPRIDPSLNSIAPCRSACEYGHYEIVTILLKDRRVDPTDVDHQISCCLWGRRRCQIVVG